MPNRIVRDAILDSPRYHGLSSDTARLLFFELLLLADDYGLTPAYPLFLSRRTSAARRATDEAIVKLVAELADHDLVRLYLANGQSYAYIPRFGNWPRAQKPKWPMPPDALGGKEIKDLQNNRSAKSAQMQSTCTANAPETETETETEKTSLPAAPAKRRDNCPFDQIVELYHEKLPELPRVKLMSAGRQRALRKVWDWTLSSTKSDGQRRATTAAGALAWFGNYFAKAAENDFLMGHTGRGAEHQNWRCDLDFLLTDKGMKHVIEKTEVAA